MNKFKYLIFIPSLFALFSCNNEKLPKRKDGDTCNITFNGDHVTPINCPDHIAIDQQLEFSLDIPYEKGPDIEDPWEEKPTADKDGVLKQPNVEYNVHIEDIHVFIGGEEFKNSFEFFYVNNAINKFTIKKQYVVNDIEINITAKPRGRLCLYGYLFSKSLDDRIDYNGHETKPRHYGDIEIKFASKYQDFCYPIRTLSGEPAFPCFECDDFDLTIRVKDGYYIPLPDNIWYRCNARYTMIDVDFTRKYSEPIIVNGETIGYRTCEIKVAKFFIHDHGSIAQYGEK